MSCCKSSDHTGVCAHYWRARYRDDVAARVKVEKMFNELLIKADTAVAAEREKAIEAMHDHAITIDGIRR